MGTSVSPFPRGKQWGPAWPSFPPGKGGRTTGNQQLPQGTIAFGACPRGTAASFLMVSYGLAGGCPVPRGTRGERPTELERLCCGVCRGRPATPLLQRSTKALHRRLFHRAARRAAACISRTSFPLSQGGGGDKGFPPGRKTSKGFPRGTISDPRGKGGGPAAKKGFLWIGERYESPLRGFPIGDNNSKANRRSVCRPFPWGIRAKEGENPPVSRGSPGQQQQRGRT